LSATGTSAIDDPAPGTGWRAMLRAFVRGDYARGFFLQVAGQVLAVMVLIEAIFLAEHFTWVFRDAVRHEADLSGIVVILGLSSTEIFDLALAIAILMATYATLLRMRENREMLVLFASGLGPVQLSALMLTVALAGQLVCAAGSGVIDPLSRYAQRSILFSSELRSLKKGVAKGEFYYFPSYVAYAIDHVQDGVPPPVAPGGTRIIDARPPPKNHDRTLFVYQQIAPHASRVVTAAQARLDGPDRKGRIVLNLNDFTSHTFADAHPLTTADGASSHTAPICKNCLDDLKDIPRVTMRVRDMSQLMMVDQLLPFNARGSIAAEQTVFEQLFVPDVPHEERADQMRLLAERFSRSLLSFLAPLVALLTVSLTTRLTSWLALPLACLALMSVNLGCEWLITVVAPMRVMAALLPVFSLYAAIACLVLALTVWRHGGFVRPQLARS
jgi:lipopolysaccharide export LptBFGC system permease protein LptF